MNKSSEILINYVVEPRLYEMVGIGLGSKSKIQCKSEH